MRKAVKNALEFWQSEGLLTPEKAQELSVRLEERDKSLEPGRAVAIFGTIGAVLVGLGVILFVGSNWAYMGPSARTMILLAGYALVVVGAVGVERRDLPKVADAIWLLATLMLGANIFLFAQIHNQSLTFWQGTLAWTIGALALGYARSSPSQAAVAVPLAVLTLGWLGGGAGWFTDDQLEFLIGELGLRPILPLVGAGLVALSTLVVRRDDTAFLHSACFRWGTVLVAAPLVISTAHVEVAEWFYAIEFTPKQVLTIIGGLLLIGLAWWKGRFESELSRPALVGVAAFNLLMVLPMLGEPWIGLELGGLHLLFGGYVVAVFALALLTIWVGIRAQNSRLVNTGMVSTALLIVIQYFGWSFTMLDGSVAFILGGVLMIALSIFIERKRREIVSQFAAPAEA